MSNLYIIYKATNIETEQVYIGATTISLDIRIADHIQKSKTGNGHHFQEAIGTYGPEAFVWEQIDTANSVNELAKKEIQYIQQYDAISNGYNSDRGGGFKKTVYQFDSKTGELLDTFESITIAAERVGAVKQNISDACIGNNNTCKEFAWSYETNYTLKSDKRKKEVTQYNLNGDYIAKYESASETSRITGISKTCIARCCRGEREQTSGFIFEYC